MRILPLSSFPQLRPPWKIGSNVKVLSVAGKEIGLTYDINTKQMSVHLNHPLTEFWLSIFKPIWEKENKDKCPICFGSGWDGETYTITCYHCKGTGKK
jgi:DnaJ-class molecular chaperone